MSLQLFQDNWALSRYLVGSEMLKALLFMCVNLIIFLYDGLFTSGT